MRMSDIRRATNLIFGDTKLKLGIFGFNGPGTAFTTAPEMFQPTWENSLTVAEMADSLGIEAQIPYQRWKAAATSAKSRCLESTTWAAAVSARTAASCVMATTHVPSLAPVV